MITILIRCIDPIAKKPQQFKERNYKTHPQKPNVNKAIYLNKYLHAQANAKTHIRTKVHDWSD